MENFHRCREEQEKEERIRRAAKRALQMEKRRRSKKLFHQTRSKFSSLFLSRNERTSLLHQLLPMEIIYSQRRHIQIFRFGHSCGHWFKCRHDGNRKLQNARNPKLHPKNI